MHDAPNLHKRQNDQTMFQAGLAHINPKEVAGWAPDAGKRGLIPCFKKYHVLKMRAGMLEKGVSSHVFKYTMFLKIP